MDNYMEYKKGTPRDQNVLFSDNLDSIIDVDNPVRVIDLYVEQLDLAKLGFKLPELKTGQAPYNPKLFLKIYIYGFLEKVHSSRKLERECKRNTEMMWLSEGLVPDHWTINNFLKTNRGCIKNVFSAFLHFCHNAELISLETVGIDGSKFRARNSKNNVYNRENIDTLSNKIDRKIKEYIEELETNDSSENEELRLKENNSTDKKLEKLKKYKNKIDEVKKKFEEYPELETYFATDEDARFQSDKGKVNPGYNAQIVVDDKNKMIAVNHVVNKSNDYELMTPMVDKLQEVKQDLTIKNHTNAILDAGYDSEKEIMNNRNKQGISIIVADKREAEKRNRERYSNKNPDKVPAEGFEPQDFKYDADRDICICPEGKELHKTHGSPYREVTGKLVNEFQCYECHNCSKRDKCTKNKRGRSVKISANKVKMDEYKQQMQSIENKKLMRKRKEIVEHPFGTIKQNWGFTGFYRKGLESVQSEFNLVCFV